MRLLRSDDVDALATLDLGFEVRGLDLNEAAIEAARSEFGDRVHTGPLDEQAFPGERFDVVTLIDVLEHVPDPRSLFAAIRARLDSEGIVAAVFRAVRASASSTMTTCVARVNCRANKAGSKRLGGMRSPLACA